MKKKNGWIIGLKISLYGFIVFLGVYSYKFMMASEIVFNPLLLFVPGFLMLYGTIRLAIEISGVLSK